MKYLLLKRLAIVAFNLLNLVVLGNLPPMAAASVVVEDQGRILLLRKPQGKWTFPGGFMRWRERPEETAVRECEEETGLRIRVLGTIGTYIAPSHSFKKMSTITITVCAELVDGTLRPSGEGRPAWQERATALQLLGEKQRHVLDDYDRYLGR